jgi:hypothetical protein
VYEFADGRISRAMVCNTENNAALKAVGREE